MAATVPQRISDLIHRFGWDIIPYLSGLGIQNLAEAQILFVDSGNIANKLDADDGVHGLSLVNPLATIDYAVGLCTASEQSIVLVAPGHAEEKAAAGALVTCDVPGVKIIGMGVGALRPTLTLSTDTGAIAFSVTAANVVISNIKILVTMDAVVKAISVAADSCKLIDVEIADNAKTTEVAIGILTTSAASNLHIERYIHNGDIDGDACTEAIRLVGVARATIKNSWFRGTFSTAAIQMLTTACSGIVVDSCIFENKTTAMTTTVVDNAVSKWLVKDCWDVVGGYGFSGGSGNALSTADITGVAASIGTILNEGGDADIGAVLGQFANSTLVARLNLLQAEANKLDSVTIDTTPVAASVATFVAGGAGGIGTQLPTSTSLYDTTKNVNTIGVTGAPVEKTLADTLHKDGNFTFDNETDSLEAIRDRVDTLNTADQVDIDAILADVSAAVPEPPTPNSIQDILHKDTNYTYSNVTDSLEAISDKITPSGAGDVWYVDSDMAADTGDGKSWATAKQTMTSGIALLTDGDTLYVRGTSAFGEAVTSPNGVDNVKIIGVSGSKRAPQWASDATGTSALTIDGEKNWEIYNMRFQAFAASTVACLHVVDGRGLVVENCYFHGGGNAHSAIRLEGSCPQSRIENSFFHEFYTIAHGNSGNNYEATIWGNTYTQSAVGVDLINNHFAANLDDVKLQAHSCRIVGNTFSKTNPLQSTTTTLNLVCSGSSCGGNVVSGNTFGTDSSELSPANGYYFSTTDIVAGNHCPDGDSAGKPAGEGKAWYVDSDRGLDTNSGMSWGRAKLTIAAAVALCADYDTIYLRGVTGFAESVVTTPAITNVKIIGVDSTKRRPEWKSAAQGSYALQIRSLDWEVHNIRFSGNLTNTVCLVKVTYDLSTYYGAGVLIKDCYFHGGGDSVGGIEFNGGGFQNDVIGCHFTDFGGVGAAGIWTTNHLNYFLHAKIVGNWFSENVNCLRINAQTCLVKDNVFQTEGAERDATVVCDLVNSGGSGCKGNCCVGNYFGDVTANITSTYGYYGGTGDLWVNETADAKDYGVPT